MYQYHISDHIIAGKTENLKFMFQAAKYAFDNKLVFHTKDNIKYPYWEPEIHLTRSFLMAKYPNNFHELDGRQLMVDNFDILNLAELTPYKVMCNLFKTYWFGDFTPEKNYSISKIEQLLNDKPPYEK